MTQRPKRPRDANQLAKRVVDIATGEINDDAERASDQRRGGRIGGARRAAVLTQEQRSEIARLAAEARWKKD